MCIVWECYQTSDDDGKPLLFKTMTEKLFFTAFLVGNTTRCVHGLGVLADRLRGQKSSSVLKTMTVTLFFTAFLVGNTTRCVHGLGVLADRLRRQKTSSVQDHDGKPSVQDHDGKTLLYGIFSREYD